RDPRIALAIALPPPTPGLALAPRLELALPLGADDAFTSAGAFTFAPGIGAELRLGRLALGADAGARLRRAVDFGAGRFGSERSAALGVAFDLVARERLTLAAEIFALPSLVGSTSARGERADARLTSLPAEWLASVQLIPIPSLPFRVSAG